VTQERDPLPATGPDAGGTVVAVRDLCVRYPGAATGALAGVTFELRAGELVGLLGLNGAGKSTLCRCLNGIVPQLVPAEVSGFVVVAGMDAQSTPVRRMASVVAVVLDEPGAQISQGTVGEEVALGLESMAVPYAEMVVRVDEALRRVGLSGLHDRPPLSLSGGEQQRLLLASALAMRPLVLVLDEPTSGLDPVARAALFDVLAGLAATDGTAIVVVEHDVELLAERVDRLLVLHDGRLVADGAPAAVLGDIPGMDAAGVRAPEVTAVAAAFRATRPVQRSEPLPVTLEEGVRWLAARV
jgi:energy-coupling factor transporter ATP-binding protein EcfA2